MASCGRVVTNCHLAATKCSVTTHLHPNAQPSAIAGKVWRDTDRVSPNQQLSCGTLHRKVQQSIVCRTHDNTQRSASLHEQTLPVDRRNQQRRAETDTFRAGSHVNPFLLGTSDPTTLKTRGGWPQGCGPSLSKNLGTVSVFGQNLHGAPPTGSVQKINLVVASWSRGEVQGGSRFLQVHLVISQIDRVSEGFQVGTAQQ